MNAFSLCFFKVMKSGSEVESCFKMCANSLKPVLKEIKQRELKEQDKDKKEILNILIERFQQYEN